ncbi:tetratricopeptide repeat protein [Ekhidna sp. To15]|uniref:tetratricopeptide repeat protein n=1 Tax=Ekhidna sp. To15 TaxID=3395267 RepID=UPI003F523600
MNSIATNFILMFIFSFLTMTSSEGQNGKIDSLLSELKGSQDTTQITLLNHIAFEFWNYDVEKAHEYAKKALTLSKETDFAKGTAWSYTNIGLYHYFKGEYKQSLKNYQASLKSIENQSHLEVYSYTLSRIGNIYRLRGAYDSAIYYYKQSLADQSIEASMSYASSCFNLGIAFLEMEAYDSAKIYLKESLTKREKLGITLFTASSKLELGRLHMEMGDLDSAAHYLDLVKQIGEKNKLPELQIYYAIYNGQFQLLKGDYFHAIESIKSSLTLLNEFQFKELRIKSLYLLGSIYSEIGEFDGALDNLLRAESLNTSFRNIKQQAQINFTLGYVYYYQRNTEKAREIAIQARDQFSQIGLDRQAAMSNNLLGLIELSVEDYDQSADYFDEGMRTYEKLNYRKGIASILYNKSYIYLELGEIQKVIDIQLQALDIEKEINNTRGIIISYNSLGNIYQKSGNYDEAEKYLLLATELLDDFPSPSDEEENNLFLSQLFYAKSDFKKAYDYLMLSKQYSDSVFSQNSLNKSLQLSAIHDLEKKELEIQNLNQEKLSKNNEISLKENQLKQQRLLIYFGTFALIFFSFLSYFLVRTIRKLRTTQQELIKAEKRASMGILIAGLGHEINNPLNFIKGGLEGMKFSRNDWSDDQNKFLDAIEEGIKRTISILDILNQFQQKKNSKLEQCDLSAILRNCVSAFDGEISKTKKIVLSKTDNQAIITGYKEELKQLFRELIKNSLQSISKKGQVSIEISSTSSECIVKITDNGIGIDKENLPLLENPFFTTKAPNDGKGFGLYLVDYTLSDHDGKIHFDSVKGEGTIATVTLPKK